MKNLCMEQGNKVSRYVEILLNHPLADLDELLRLLVADGASEIEAEALTALVPMAFARVLLVPMGVSMPETFIIKDIETNRSVRGLLGDQAVFRAATDLARRMFADPNREDEAERVAMCSAEYSAVRQLRSDGSGLEGGTFTETVLVRLPLDYLNSSKAGNVPMHARQESDRSKSEEPIKQSAEYSHDGSRPWWKFW